MATPQENAMEIVRDYIFSLPALCARRGCTLEEYSRSNWAAHEMLRCLEREKGIPPLIVLEKFQEQMRRYSQKNSIFSTAHHTAETVIRRLIS